MTWTGSAPSDYSEVARLGNAQHQCAGLRQGTGAAILAGALGGWQQQSSPSTAAASVMRQGDGEGGPLGAAVERGEADRRAVAVRARAGTGVPLVGGDGEGEAGRGEAAPPPPRRAGAGARVLARPGRRLPARTEDGEPMLGRGLLQDGQRSVEHPGVEGGSDSGARGGASPLRVWRVRRGWEGAS